MNRLNYASFVQRFKEGVVAKHSDQLLAEYLLGSIFETVPVLRRQFKKSKARERYYHITAREASRFIHQLDNIPVALVAAASDQRVINNAPSYFEEFIVPLLDSDKQWKMFSKLHDLIETADNIDNKTRARFMELAENIKDPDQKAKYLAAVFMYAVKQENKLTKENGGSKKQSKDILYTKLMDNFIYTRDQHPSILMMKPAPYLFPKGLPSISNTERTVVKGEDQPLSIKEMVQESWKKNKHLLLIGEGGIGKTVVMLTLPEEDWFRQYKIPTIYVPLQRLDLKDGKLDDYLNARFEDDVRDKIIELSNRIPKGHPELILLLDGFNEIPDKYKGTAEKAIMDWMERPGIQIITTSRMGFSIEKKYLKYDLQPLPKKTIKSFLLSSGLEELKLPRETDQIWKVINIPLMLSLYTQIEKVRDVAYGFSNSFLLDWKKPDNAANIIWDYLQIELLRCLEKKDPSHSQAQYAVSIFAVAPYICCQMAEKAKFHINHQEFLSSIKEAISFYTNNKNLLNQQILNICLECGPCSEIDVFQEIMVSEYSEILIKNVVLFEKQKSLDKEGKLDYTYSLVHQNFRDALAAFYICSCLPKVRGRKEKTRLLEYADHYVKNYIAAFFSEDELVKIWNQHREEDYEDGHITYMLMDIIGRQRNYDYSEIDFSNLNLTNINIHSLMSKNVSICPFPKRKELFNHTSISLKSISPVGHSGGVLSVSFREDGKQIVSGSRDKTVRVWTLNDGECLTLKGHFLEVNSVEYGPYEGQITSGSIDGTIHIWNLENGKNQVLVDVSSDNYQINSIAYNTERSLIAGGLDNDTIQIWNNKGEEILLLEGQTESITSELYEFSVPITSVLFSPNGRQLASRSEGGRFLVWNLDKKTSKMLRTRITCIAYDPRNGQLASGSFDGDIEIWYLDGFDNWKSYKLDNIEEWITCIEYNPKRQQVAGGTAEGSLYIWNLESKEKYILKGHSGCITCLSYSSDGRQLVSGSKDRSIRVWDLDNGKKQIFSSMTNFINCVSYSPNGKHIACCSSDGTLRIWNWESELCSIFESNSNKMLCVSYSPDGNNIAGLSDNGVVNIWNNNSMCHTQIGYTSDRITTMAYSPDGEYLTSGSEYGTVLIWNLYSEESHLLGCHSDTVSSISYSPEGKYIVTGSYDETIILWDLDSGNHHVLEGHTDRVYSVSFNPDGQHVASSSGDGTIRIWNLNTKNSCILVSFPEEEIYCVAYSQDGKKLAISGLSRGMIGIWDFENDAFHKFSGQSNTILSVAFSPDCKFLTSGSIDGNVRIWDLSCLDLDNPKEFRRFQIIPHINLHGANFELAILDEKDKELFKMAGAKTGNDNVNE